MPKSLLETLREERSTINDTLAGGLAAQELRDDHQVTAEEQAEFNRLARDAEELDQRVADIEAVELRRGAAQRAAAGVVHVRSEPRVYERGNGNGYFVDLAIAHAPGQHDRAPEAMARLQRHAEELAIDLPARAARRADRAEDQLRSTFGDTSAFEKRVNPNRTDGQGGYFVPPLWLIDDYIPLLRAGRTTVDQLRPMDLPDGTDSINIPAVATGTATGVQTGDGVGVTSTDFTDTVVSAPVRTIAGQEDVAMQLVEQSPGQIIDQVVTMDLLADYNQRCDLQSLNGSGAAGQVLGLRNVASPNAVTYTDATPTVPELWTPLAQSLSLLAQTRFSMSNVKFFMHPRRWFWIASALDTANRPLVVPAATGSLSPMATSQQTAEGYVGNTVLGPPVYIDANITAIQGGGTNQDEIYAIKTDDTYWFEGNLRTRVLYEILSGTLQVRFQIYNYVAQLTRYSKSISIIGGTGLIGPAGF